MTNKLVPCRTPSCTNLTVDGDVQYHSFAWVQYGYVTARGSVCLQHWKEAGIIALKDVFREKYGVSIRAG